MMHLAEKKLEIQSINKWESYSHLNFDKKLPYGEKLIKKWRILDNHLRGCCGPVIRPTEMLRTSSESRDQAYKAIFSS